MSTKENEGRKKILGDNPVVDDNILEQMLGSSKMLSAWFDDMPIECALSVMIEYCHTRCHRVGIYFPDMLESAKACAEMIEHDSEFWYLESEVK